MKHTFTTSNLTTISPPARVSQRSFTLTPMCFGDPGTLLWPLEGRGIRFEWDACDVLGVWGIWALLDDTCVSTSLF